jgi:hypothetical protein
MSTEKKAVRTTDHSVRMTVTKVENGFIITDSKNIGKTTSLHVATDKQAILDGWIRRQLEEALIALEKDRTLVVSFDCYLQTAQDAVKELQEIGELTMAMKVPDDFGLPAVDDLPFTTTPEGQLPAGHPDVGDSGTIDFSKSKVRRKP